MITIPGISGKRFAVMGLGASGLAAARSLMRSGAEIRAWDDDPARRDAARGEGLTVTAIDGPWLAGAEALVLSPGIPHRFPAPHPVAAEAGKRNVPILCDVELLARAQGPARFLGITGTNGKSTVTALLGHLFRAANRPFALGGNFGPPALGLASLDKEGRYILELSSYQLERMTTAVIDIAVLINITSDHLDRHGGMEGYVAAKARLFDLLRGSGTSPATAVIGADDPDCLAIAARLADRADLRLLPVSGNRVPPNGIGTEGSLLLDAREGTPRPLCDLASAAALRGEHNRQNAAAAAAAALAAGIAPETVARSLLTFPGLAHRQEPVRRIGRVLYVNDSKATNVRATLTAIHAHERIHLICGGRAKPGGFAPLAAMAESLRRVYLIGEAADEIALALHGKVACIPCGTLGRALAEAHKAAQEESRRDGQETVVLLSPACASFDQFTDFGARGEAFRSGVLALDGERAEAMP